MCIRDRGGWVDVTYRNNNSALAQNATLTAQALRIDVTPGFSEAILEGSMRFTLGGSTYVDRQGLLYRDPDPVSYTHLDVYKRQPPRRGRWQMAAP